MIRKFWTSRSGNFALMTGILALPLLLGVGMAVDYSRHVSAQKHLQEIADSVSLALAASSERNAGPMALIAQKIINANQTNSRIDVIDKIKQKNLTVTATDVDVALSGRVKTTFMGIAGYDYLEVKATSLATRAINGGVEVALVLDNTWSMSETDVSGKSKIDTLKSAAGSLVDALMSGTNSGVKISLVPYADYVNVGVANRSKPWLAVGPDVPGVADTCVMKDVVVTWDCKVWQPKTCTYLVDGVPENYDCGSCTEYVPPYTVTQNVCSGGSYAQKWHGCVGSRMVGDTRLDDKSLGVPYPGYVEPWQQCLNPIVPLTDNKATLKAAVSGMIINIGGYKPFTYIPAGMIWGVNMLSPSAPFSEGAAYDSANKKPRKAIVLMTDGENTLKFQAADGRHVAFNSDPATAATEYATVNAETLKICAYAKSKNIEIYTVAFMVSKSDAKAMLESCATDTGHYFDASDPAKLTAAFTDIAQSLSIVRLAR